MQRLIGCLVGGIVLPLVLVGAAKASTCPAYTYSFTNGSTADATQVNSDFNSILSCANTSLAPLASPTFTGTPLAPTAAPGTNTTQIATTAFVRAITVTNSMLATVPANTFKGNNTGSTATPIDMTAAQAAAILPVFVGDSGSGGTRGLVPAPASGSAAGGQFLSASGAFAFPVGFVLQVQNRQTSGTASGDSLTASTWTQRTLNTVVANTIPGASLSSNKITLPAGTYHITAIGETSLNGSAYLHKLRIRDTTASTTVAVGPSPKMQQNTGGDPNTVEGHLQGVFTLTSTDQLELDSWVNVTSTGGYAASSGEVEVYADVILWKIG